MSTSTIQTNSADAAAPSIPMRRQKNVEQGFLVYGYGLASL